MQYISISISICFRFLNPITYGSYPPIILEYLGARLPEFTPTQSKLVMGSIDFLGFHYYTAFYVKDLHLPPGYPWPESFGYDMRVGISCMFIYFPIYIYLK